MTSEEPWRECSRLMAEYEAAAAEYDAAWPEGSGRLVGNPRWTWQGEQRLEAAAAKKLEAQRAIWAYNDRRRKAAG